MIERLIGILTILLFVNACGHVSPKSETSQASESGRPKEARQIEPRITQFLPQTYLGYEYAGFYVFPEPSQGYALRYYYSRHNFADIFVYPVPDAIRTKPHRDIVVTMANNANYEIRTLQARDYQRPFETLTERMLHNDGIIIAKMGGTFLRNNLQSFTLMYLTEHENILIKARLTMPDNEHNRSNEQWDTFVSNMFTLIARNLKEQLHPPTPQLTATD